MDEKQYNEIALEQSIYKKWEKERKAQILAMSNPKRKQQEWRKLFPIMTLDDSYLETNVDIW